MELRLRLKMFPFSAGTVPASVVKQASTEPTAGWSGGAMALGNFPVPGLPTKLDYSGTRAYCACSRCG